MNQVPARGWMKTMAQAAALAAALLPGVARADGGRLDPSVLSNPRWRTMTLPPAGGHGPPTFARASGIADVDSLVNFTGSFQAAGVGADGDPQDEWTYAMVGSPPGRGGVTLIDAPIVAVSLDLLNDDGTLFAHVDATQFVLPVLLSPVFAPARWASSPLPTQFTDAFRRAEFSGSMRHDWHTLLVPRLVRARTLRLQAASYATIPNPDGTCCNAVLVDLNTFVAALFPLQPGDTSSVLGELEASHEISTRSITTLLFPNTFLTDPAEGCCILGFHSYDAEPGDSSNGDRERRYVMNYASWISPGIVTGGFGDVTALSHEMSELFDDPFVGSDGVHNIVPWWQSGGECQDLNEVGDAVESLADAVFSVRLNGMTYHPQNEAMLPWFARESPSSALDGAYSFPDANALPQLSPPEALQCGASLPPVSSAGPASP